MENGTDRIANNQNTKNGNRSKKLFTPGPLGVSRATKEAMLRDLGSREREFINIIKSVRTQLMEIAGVSEETYSAVLIQGSGTFSVEAALTTSIPRENPKVLLLVNGAYGMRMAKIVQAIGIPDSRWEVMRFPEDQRVSPAQLEERFKRGECDWTNVAIVHCETTSGVFNPITSVGKLVKKYCPDAFYLVDAMSSFGAVPIDLGASHIDLLVSSANKCLEGVPGFAYAIARIDALKRCQGNARSLSLDLYDQWEGFSRDGQFRFTPPTHTILALNQALLELREEGGVSGRCARYQENRRVLREGMREMGFKEFLDDTHEGYIITSYPYPNHPNFSFTQMYQGLGDMGLVIYPGRATQAECFRIGNIGHLFPEDMRHLLSGMRQVLADMGIALPLTN